MQLVRPTSRRIMALWFLATLLGFYLGLLHSTSSALQCLEWGVKPVEAKNVSCDGDCVTVTIEGWNRITRQELSVSIGMCDIKGCNTACDKAVNSLRNFDVKNCNAKCCNQDLCNAIYASPTPIKETIKTEEKHKTMKRVTRGATIQQDGGFTGLQCYKCQEGTDYQDCYNIQSIEYCAPDHNSCFSITGTLSRQFDKVVTHRGCGLETVDCNITQLCTDTRNKLFVNHDVHMETCNAYCCKGHFCNRYIPTRPTAGQQTRTPISTRPRRTVKRSQSPPVKCYECKPDTFSRMCKTNDTERSCVTGRYGYDGCFTMTVTIGNATSGELLDIGQWKGCAVRDDDCNANSSRCATLGKILDRRGLQLRKCLIDCCQGDLCNSFLPTAGPNITAYAISQAHIGCKLSQLSLIMTLISYWMKD